MHPALQDVQFRLVHNPAQAEQEAIVVVGRTVETILVSQHRSKERAQFDQLMPVLIGPRQSTQLDSQDHADVIEAYFGQEPLKSAAPFGGSATVALVFVDHFDTFRRPA